MTYLPDTDIALRHSLATDLMDRANLRVSCRARSGGEDGRAGTVAAGQRTWDTIIVGAGPAGCVLASRLSEQSDRTVLLIDAGPDYGSNPGDWPEELVNPYHSAVESHSWGYLNAVTVGGVAIPLPRGRLVGGCSAVNACIWLRGSRIDYDGWEAFGNPGWSWDDLRPYFLRAETDDDGDPVHHGHDGPIRISRASAEEYGNADRAVLEAAQELGFGFIDDLNASVDQEPCIGPTPRNIVDGCRQNAALTYLARARDRDNLTILPDTLVDRVLLKGRHAHGVITAGGDDIRGGEVILSSGAYASPALLMRSGIGPAEHLRDMGIEVRHALAGVGAHLLDHPFIAPYTSGLSIFPLRPGSETGTRKFIQVMIEARSSQVDREIDLHLYPREIEDPLTGGWRFGFGVSLQYARSKGRVRLTSTDPEAPLDIDHNYFSDPADLEALCDGLELVGRLVTTPPLSGLIDLPVDAPVLGPRDRLRALIRAEIGTTFHPSSTCRMGPATDLTAVVDAECRVHGIDNLRVVDASVFPWGPRCNLHGPVVAVAERMADVVASVG